MSQLTQEPIADSGAALSLPKAEDHVAVNDVVICLIDEWRSGKKQAFDCNVIARNEKGIDALYLSGFRSRNDFVLWEDIVAKVDKSMPSVKLGDYGFSGSFQIFKS